MATKARISNDANGNITVHMEGGLDHETNSPLRDELIGIADEYPTSAITLDLNKLEFVGSSGIGHFIETIKILNQKKNQIKLSNVQSEFLKVFKLYEFDALEALMASFDDDETDYLGQKFASRGRTFEN